LIYTKDWCVLHIPRTSGTNFKVNALMKYNNSAIMPHASPTITDRLSQHNPITSFDMGSRKVYAVIRHPYTRALSLYTYAVNDPAFKVMFNNVSFRDFWELDISEYCDWSLKTPQYDFIDDTVKTFKIEESLAELYSLTKVISYKSGVNSSVSNINDYNNNNNRILVESIFNEDYHRFNYKKGI
jgi:hypothetical protein